MKIEKVSKLKPIDRFLYWIRERRTIYLRRQRGESRPWTDDEVLQQYFFTNPYRENDKTTVWFRENVRDPLRNNPAVLMATVIFRWFNWIETGEALLDAGLLLRWNANQCVRLLQNQKKIFTGAYMITAGGNTPGCKLPNVCRAISNVWQERDRLVETCLNDCRLEALCQKLKRFPYLGGFMSYEIACDLRYTYLLENASDKLLWCNPGPGAKRGLDRLLVGQYRPLKQKAKDWKSQTVKLLKIVRRRLPKMPVFEMREVEHSLCEWDKYERARLQDGHLKRRYNGNP